MQPITIPYLSFVLSVLLFCGSVFFACYFAAKCARHLRENLALSKAYAELLAGSQKREAALIAEKDAWAARASSALGDSERLAAIVAEYLKIIDDTAALMKDEQPPPMAAEREALRFHAQFAMALRSVPSSPTSVSVTNSEKQNHEEATQV